MQLKKEQEAVINHGEGNLLVSASAGSGKTFTMIRRLIRLITEGKANVNEILAVTFTEKAAAEMKEKLRKAMFEEIAAGNTVLKEQVGDIYTADICTLHAFCGRLLRTYFFEAGLSADFDIADSAKAAEIKQRTVTELFEELYAEEDEGLNMLVKRHASGRRDERLKQLVQNLYEFSRSEADPEEALEKSLYGCGEEGFEYFYREYNILLKRRFAAAAGRAVSLAAEAEKAGLKKYADFCVKLSRGEIEDMPRVKLQDEAHLQIRENIKILKGEIKDIIEAEENAADKNFHKTRQLSCRAHAENLIRLVEMFSERYAEEKREVNVADFNDLEHFALKILRIPEINKEVREKYKYVFTDEYQDISGVQEKILALVSDNNLFTVGDLKQSIYGFRGCNADLFRDKERAYTASGQVVYLNDNFRSADAVINGVNAICDEAMTEDFSDVDYKGTSRLTRGGLYPEGSGRFSIDVLEIEKKKRESETPRIYDLTEETRSPAPDAGAGEFIAELIGRELGKEYYDVSAKAYKKVGYGDIAVLTRSRTEYTENIIKSLLRRGIPVAAESRNSITEYAEIKTLVDILSLIDNFKQDLPLCSALKSLWRITDEELAEIRVFANDFCDGEKRRPTFYEAYKCYIENAAGELKENLCKFDGYMRRVRLLADECGAAELIERVMRECALDVRFAASPSGKQKLKRIRRFLAEASGAKKLTVREFLERIENSEDNFTLAETGGDDTVKIVTLHSSKGLEYPVVIIAGIERGFNFKDIQSEVLLDRKYGFAPRCYDDETKTYGETIERLFLKEIIKDNLRKEELRLFYVGLTRAKYSLILAGVNVKPSLDVRGAERFADFIPETVPVNYHGEDFITGAGGKRGFRKIVIGEPDEILTERIRENFAFRYPFEKETVTPLKTSVTESLKGDGEYLSMLPEISETDAETSAEKGTAMHKFLEVCDLHAENAESEAERLLSAGLLGQEEFDLLNIPALQKLLSSGVFSALCGSKLYREQWFLTSCPAELALGESRGGEVLLQGIIDLLAVNGNEAVIYDYKYSRKNAEALKATYAKQLKLYKYAVEKSLGLNVKAAYIISLAGAEIIKIDL